MLYVAVHYAKCCDRGKPSVRVSSEEGLLTQSAEEIKEYLFEDVGLH